MKYFLILIPALLVTGCTANPAAAAADAAFCVSAESTLTTIGDAYQSGLIDSGVIEGATNLLSTTVGKLVTPELSDSLSKLSDTVTESEPVAASQQQVDALLADIRLRCSEVGVDF